MMIMSAARENLTQELTGEFTCDNGQCIEMEERCNQVTDCRVEAQVNSLPLGCLFRET